MENLLMTLVSIVDTAMVGAIGAYATSAVALVASPTWVVNAAVQGAGAGCSVLVAHRVGAGSWDGARRGARESMTIGLMTGIFFFVVMELLSSRIPVWMGGEPDICPLSTAYLRIVAAGYPLYIMGLVTCGAIRGAGDTSTPMRITATANILNMILNYLLIYPARMISIGSLRFAMWGAGMGVAGAAAATAVSTAISGFAVLVILLRRKEGLFVRMNESFRLVRQDMREVLEVALPTSAERLTINIGQIFFIRVISSLGTVMLAAHHIAVTAEAVSYNPGFGYQAAGTLGRIIYDGAKQVKILGETIEVKAEVTLLDGISGHADQAGLLRWLGQFEKKPSMIFVNHGDDDACQDFTRCLRAEHGYAAFAPYSGSVFDLAAGAFVYEAEPKPIQRDTVKGTTKQQRKPSPAYLRLAKAGEALMAIIRHAEGRPNKVLNALADAVERLVKEYK